MNTPLGAQRRRDIGKYWLRNILFGLMPMPSLIQIYLDTCLPSRTWVVGLEFLCAVSGELPLAVRACAGVIANPVAMGRLVPCPVRHSVEDGDDEEREYGEPTEPCKGDHGREDSAGLILGAECGEVWPD